VKAFTNLGTSSPYSLELELGSPMNMVGGGTLFLKEALVLEVIV